ncbi:MAG TPA: DUF1080 domain-containing protein [Verrucomicrobiota bacterium]|nr:DUF1080 domain-containing protein [Verrucomicrobiota bacterium]
MTKYALALVMAAAAMLNAAAGEWTPLFNGKDLNGWIQRGGNAPFAVEDGMIVGRSVPDTPNSFLCTERSYTNFILEYEFKIDPRLNSGVQIRSLCFDEPTSVEWQGRTIRIPAGRVHGYQIEIDPDVQRGRMWTAGIYDEARRGWLYPSDGESGPQGREFSDLGKRIFKSNDWNHVWVEAIGDTISTWLNGVPCAEIKDSMTPAGFIALQVHGMGNDKTKEAAEVRWRNLRIREVDLAASQMNTLTEEERSNGWRLLWDGRTTAGWRSARSNGFPATGWEIKDGILTVLPSGGGESVGGGDIITEQRYSDFELLVDFRITPGANSGIKYFVQPNLDPVTGSGMPAATGSAVGLEFQILDDQRHPDAKLGRNGNRTLGSLYDLMPAKDKQPNPIGAWNTARIVSRGRHVEHWLNGRKILEYERGSESFRELVSQSKYRGIPGFGEWKDGHILLQDHGDRVSFRNIKIRTP